MLADAALSLSHPLARLLGYQLRRAASYMQADLAKRTAGVGLTLVEMSVLFVIEANPGITQSEIGRMLSIKRANMAPLTGVLMARALIDKTIVNGRSHGLSLSATGAEIVEKLHIIVDQNEAHLVSRLPKDGHAMLMALLPLIWNAQT